jgi:hypothetical protein
VVRVGPMAEQAVSHGAVNSFAQLDKEQSSLYPF